MAFYQGRDKLLGFLGVIGHILIAHWFILVSGDDKSPKITTAASTTTKNLTSNGSSDSKQNGDGLDPYESFELSQKNMYRMLIVLLTITVVTICFFTCKFYSSKRAKKAKKYGVLATSGADVELRPLDDDEDDEDDVFNVNR